MPRWQQIEAPDKHTRVYVMYTGTGVLVSTRDTYKNFLGTTVYIPGAMIENERIVEKNRNVVERQSSERIYALEESLEKAQQAAIKAENCCKLAHDRSFWQQKEIDRLNAQIAGMQAKDAQNSLSVVVNDSKDGALSVAPQEKKGWLSYFRHD